MISKKEILLKRLLWRKLKDRSQLGRFSLVPSPKEEKMQRKNNNHMERVNEEFKKEISNIINYNLKEPTVTGMISVTKVKVTTDLKYAKVAVSILNAKDVKETLAGLKKSSGYIRTELAKRINLRNTPEIIFELDESLEYGAKIDSILKDIMKDVKKEES